jgi:phosphoribosylanthranilate isomerase
VTKVKVCGITTLEDALVACEAGADALGFNFVPAAAKKGRNIEPEGAAEIAAQLPPFVTTVAVCVNPAAEDVAHWLTFLDAVQFHGDETAAFCEPFAARSVKAFQVGPDFSLDTMSTYPTAGYLLDSYSRDARGGTGETFDWTVAKEAVGLGKPLVLAGGLTPDNVAEAIRAVRPYAVDTASGVESTPGKKDHDKLRSFVRNAKDALPVS